MLEGRLQLEGRDLDAKMRKLTDQSGKEGPDDKNRGKPDRSGVSDSRVGIVDKAGGSSAGTQKKSIIDLVNLSQEEPKSEVERMIQHKLLQKKMSGQGSSASDNQGEGNGKTVGEGLVSDTDILNQFRGVEMEEGMESDGNRQGSQLQAGPRFDIGPSENKNKNSFQEDFDADDGGDDPMMGIWGGPTEEPRSSRFVTKTMTWRTDTRRETSRQATFKKTTTLTFLVFRRITTPRSRWARSEAAVTDAKASAIQDTRKEALRSAA